MDTKTAIHPKTGRLMPRSNGRPMGSKNKVTLLREQMQAKSAGIVSAIKLTPLEVLLNFMEEAVAEYRAAKAVAAPEPLEEDGTEEGRRLADAAAKTLRAHEKAIDRARAHAMEAAIAAAPFTHARLKTVDKNTKRNLTIQVLTFGESQAILNARPDPDAG